MSHLKESYCDAILNDGRLPVWAGTVCALVSATAIIGFDAYRHSVEFELSGEINSRGPTLWVLRSAFLLIATGAFWRMRGTVAREWRFAVRAALAVLAAGVFVDAGGALLCRDWLLDPATPFTSDSDVAKRLFRLGLMAAYAIPTLVLLAATQADCPPAANTIAHSPPVSLLLRWEPVLFLVAAATLSPLLVAAAAFGSVIVWLLPIGADASIAACVAAAIRACDRADPYAFAGWLEAHRRSRPDATRPDSGPPPDPGMYAESGGHIWSAPYCKGKVRRRHREYCFHISGL